jgi:hypothetical protein
VINLLNNLLSKKELVIIITIKRINVDVRGFILILFLYILNHYILNILLIDNKCIVNIIYLRPYVIWFDMIFIRLKR